MELMNFTQKLAVGCLILASSTANAALVTINGTNVSFTYDDATLYGTANVVGNAIFFGSTRKRVG